MANERGLGDNPDGTTNAGWNVEVPKPPKSELDLDELIAGPRPHTQTQMMGDDGSPRDGGSVDEVIEQD